MCFGFYCVKYFYQRMKDVFIKLKFLCNFYYKVYFVIFLYIYLFYLIPEIRKYLTNKQIHLTLARQNTTSIKYRYLSRQKKFSPLKCPKSLLSEGLGMWDATGGVTIPEWHPIPANKPW